jgi:hypothetical protein
MVVPMKGQYEQHYNAAALQKMEVPILKKVKKKKHVSKIEAWIETAAKVTVQYDDITQDAVKQALALGLRG